MSELIEDQDSEHEEMDFWEHVGELRKRLIQGTLAIALAATLGWFISTETFHFLSAPFFNAFPEGQLIGTGPAEAFLLRLKVALFVGVLLASPVLFLQLWLFISPGLLEHEKKFALPFVLVTSSLFLIGVWFCYQIVLPFALDFFQDQYQALNDVTPTIRVSEYLSLLMKAAIGFGVIFETPVLAFILGRLGLITDDTLISAGRYAVIVIFMISAILTPPDILTQFLMAGPLLILYGLSILIVRYTSRETEAQE